MFPNDGPYDQYIDVTGITELHSVVMDGTNLLIGGNVTLTQVMATMESAAASDASAYGYCARFAEHFKKVANTNVRNVATMAGNLVRAEKTCYTVQMTFFFFMRVLLSR